MCDSNCCCIVVGSKVINCTPSIVGSFEVIAGINARTLLADPLLVVDASTRKEDVNDLVRALRL